MTLASWPTERHETVNNRSLIVDVPPNYGKYWCCVSSLPHLLVGVLSCGLPSEHLPSPCHPQPTAHRVGNHKATLLTFNLSENTLVTVENSNTTLLTS